MSQVSLQINGYGYILGCADGEEHHLRSLAGDLDRRIEEIKASNGPSGEARLLLMAALVLSDELHDLREQMGLRNGDGSPAAKSEPKARPAAARTRQTSRGNRRYGRPNTARRVAGAVG